MEQERGNDFFVILAARGNTFAF